MRERNPPRGVDFIPQVLCVYPTGEISLHRSCTHAHIHMRAGPVLFCIRVCLCVCVKHMKCTARTFCLPTFQVLVTRDEEKRVRRDLSLTKINGMMSLLLPRPAPLFHLNSSSIACRFKQLAPFTCKRYAGALVANGMPPCIDITAPETRPIAAAASRACLRYHFVFLLLVCSLSWIHLASKIHS